METDYKRVYNTIFDLLVKTQELTDNINIEKLKKKMIDTKILYTRDSIDDLPF